MRSPRHPAVRGIALLSVLWILVLLSFAVTGLSATVRDELRGATAAIDLARARRAAAGGVELGVADLLAPQAQRWSANGAIHEFDVAGVEVVVTVRDEAGKVDINKAQPELMAALLRAAGAADERAARLADSIADWRDPDGLRRLQGAEDPDYRAAGLPHGAGDRSFYTVDELALVIGMDADILAVLRPHVTVHSGVAGVNPALASPLVRAAAGEAAHATMNVEGLAYTVHARATAPDGVHAAVSVTVALTPGRDGKPYRVLAWGEPSRQVQDRVFGQGEIRE